MTIGVDERRRRLPLADADLAAGGWPEDGTVTPIDRHRGANRPDTERLTRDAAVSRPATLRARRMAVERVVATMSDRLDAPLSLRDMADVALLSPQHFNRVFRSVTGVPPQLFLTCLRMQAAKRLLLTTALRVTDVCFSVGYQSVGTFTSRFTELVGIPPRRFRELSKDEDSLMRAVLRSLEAERISSDVQAQRDQVVGRVLDHDCAHGPIFVGLFRNQTPGGCPAGCALLAGADTFRIGRVADGRYRVLAVGFPWSSNIRDYLLPDPSNLRVAASRPFLVREGIVTGNLDVTLRTMEATDPPVVVALHAAAWRRPESTEQSGEAGALSAQAAPGI